MSKKIIVIPRGDTYIFDLIITGDDGQVYELGEEDILYFGLMDPHQKFEDALVKKRFTKEDENFEDHSIEIVMKPEDTIDLIPGVYYYAIKLRKIESLAGIDDVITVVNKTKFVITD